MQGLPQCTFKGHTSTEVRARQSPTHKLDTIRQEECFYPVPFRRLDLDLYIVHLGDGPAPVEAHLRTTTRLQMPGYQLGHLLAHSMTFE